MEINSKVDEVMEAKGVTLDQLIEKSGLPRMTVFNARRGLNVTIKTAFKISEALGVSVDEIWSTEILEPEVEELANLSTG